MLAMMQRHHFRITDLQDRAKFIWMWKDGFSVRMIANETGTSVTTVYRWIRRWQREGNLCTKTRSGRPRLLLKEENPQDQQQNNPGHTSSSSALDASSYHPWLPNAVPPRSYLEGQYHSLLVNTDRFNKYTNTQDNLLQVNQSPTVSAFRRYVARSDGSDGRRLSLR
ncbi:putative winged helix-turn-helix domain containing protein 12 [Homarus americanus]|uniref:Putative winged helix-turn-helix domain containing protein 12 n=1 Tax=Homarus americanus TaxID=6706 RepID=A0A8J5JL52_HOMAM|nr:putative winged helix-turn-helix domain containing protein 12 [Homarus americanus]